MTDLPKKAGPRPTPRTAIHGRKLFSNDKIISLTKEAIAVYIESFFKENGENRDLLQIVSPWSISLNMDKSFDPRTDPTQRKIQIARMFSEIRSILPSILIMDGGIISRNENIGQIQSAYLHNSNWDGYFPILKTIPINIIIATRDQETLGQLASTFSLMFNELRNIAGGHYLIGNRDEGETWVVTLPHMGVTLGPPQESDIENDPVDRVHYCDLTMDVHFEDVIGIRDTLPTLEGGRSIVNKDLSTIRPVIYAPDTISINEQITVLVTYFKDSYRIKISDPNVATISNKMVLTPRRLGTFKIQVYDEGGGSTINDAPLTEKEITIV